MKRHRKLHTIGSGMVGILSCLLLFSCNDGDFSPAIPEWFAGENICFGIYPAETNRTRAIANKDSRVIDNFVLRREGVADTLCVRASVSGGIVSSALESNRHPLTRAAQITSLEPYGKFHLLAYWTMSGQVLPQFYMNDTVKLTNLTTGNGEKIWSTDHPYYWFTDGDKHKLQFYAYAPVGAGIVSPAAGTGDRVLAYEVPSDVAAQQDVVLASTGNFVGNYCDYVPLNFKHICTAVRFVVGSNMPAGKITGITLSGIPYKGTYDMTKTYNVADDVTDSWTLDAVAEPGTFAQTLNKVMSGSDAAGTEITPAEGTFIMLPQVLPEGASAAVTFEDAVGGTRELTASLAGHKWPMGKTVTYKIAISSDTPEYGLDIEIAAKDKVQDSHYVSFPIQVTADNFTGSWTLTSNNTANVFFTPTQSDFQQQGYWVDEQKGEATIQGTGSGTYYVYVTENEETVNRSIELRLRPSDVPENSFVKESITQLYTLWNEATGLGSERIEETINHDNPWGFSWDGVVEEFRTSQGNGNKVPPGQIDNITNALEAAGLGNLPPYITLVTRQDNDGILLSIDYSQIAIDVAKDLDDGYENTMDLYNFDGIKELASLKNFISQFDNIIHVDGSGDPIQNSGTEFAALSALKKNKFHVETKTASDGTPIDVLILNGVDANWFLPAVNQYPSVIDNEYPLNGNYWTSTAIVNNLDNTKAYMHSSGNFSPRLRTDLYNIRAIRKR